MALLVLLARAAPAGVVAADLVVIALDHRLGNVGTGAATVAAPRGGGIRQLRPGRSATSRRRDLRQRRGLCFQSAARIVERARLLRRRKRLLRLRRGDVDLHVEDQSAELLPD